MKQFIIFCFFLMVTPFYCFSQHSMLELSSIDYSQKQGKIFSFTSADMLSNSDTATISKNLLTKEGITHVKHLSPSTFKVHTADHITKKNLGHVLKATGFSILNADEKKKASIKKRERNRDSSTK